MLLELYGEARLAGELENEKALIMKAIYTRIALRLEERWPNVKFDHAKVVRKLVGLLRLWKTFISIDGVSGTSRDPDTGLVLTSDELWAYFIRKHGSLAKILKRSGLKYRELYERAFAGSEEVGLTAVEAIDRDGLDALHGAELSSEEGSEDEEEVLAT